MVQQCKNICHIDYKVAGRSGSNLPDWPSCDICDVRINVEGKIWCPCCHTRLSYARVKLGRGEVSIVKA